MERLSVPFILEYLQKLHPNAHCELTHRNPYELSVAVILSAQTTPTKDVEKYIASLGLYRNKARQIVGFAKGVVEQFNGEVPHTMEELTTLPGIGRKCANVIMAECFNIPSIAVDTHVARISRRLGLCYQKDDVEKIERKLMRKIPRDRWIKTHHQMIFFGRYLCHARNPECYRCPFVNGCHEKQKNLTPPKTK